MWAYLIHTAARAVLFGAVVAASWPGTLSAQPGGDAQETCPRRPVQVSRWWSEHHVETREVTLVDCAGQPRLDALLELSVLARPRGVDRPSPGALERALDRPDAELVTGDIAWLDPGLLTRLQRLADRWPGRRIEIISGYRPQSRGTSRHHHARALDLRLEGVSRRSVSEYARTFPKTGVGFYPNSLFTHVDVREESAYWVDRSAPGQRADYGPLPDIQRERDETRKEVLATMLAAVEALEEVEVGSETQPPTSEAPLEDAAELPPADGDPEVADGTAPAEAPPSPERRAEAAEPAAPESRPPAPDAVPPDRAEPERRAEAAAVDPGATDGAVEGAAVASAAAEGAQADEAVTDEATTVPPAVLAAAAEAEQTEVPPPTPEEIQRIREDAVAAIRSLLEEEDEGPPPTPEEIRRMREEAIATVRGLLEE